MPKRLEPHLSGPSLTADLRGTPRTNAPAPQKRGVWRWLLWLMLLGAAAVFVPVLAWRWIPPPITAFMLMSPVKPVQYQWVPKSQIADVARRAVVAAEDQKFWEHQGFDIEAIEKAVAHNKKSRRKRGASTISQQTAKNLFLWSGGGYFRKGLEAGYTILIEALWSKDRILEVYLNVAEFGPGLYGVEAASQKYFRKPAARLTANEAARLASILPSPRRWSVSRPGPYVQKRVNWILGQMGYGPRHEAAEEPVLPPELEQDLDDSLLPAPTEGPAPEGMPAGVPALPEAPQELQPAPEPAATSPAEAAEPADQPAVEAPPESGETPSNGAAPP